MDTCGVKQRAKNPTAGAEVISLAEADAVAAAPAL